MEHTATYSLADDKLRIYPAYRLDAEDYATVKAAGLQWAPKQECFYQVWTPAREDVALALAGDIEDEDITPQERAAVRAERYNGYSSHAAARAESAQEAAARIMDGIPLGQPILVGHHSQRHAERDAEKIRSGIRRAVDEMKAVSYWQERAAATLRHVDYKERPDVIARRIKTLEADLRKQEKERKQSAALLNAWGKVGSEDTKLALAISNYECGLSFRFTLAEYPRDHDTYEGDMGLWSALDRQIITAAQAAALAMPAHAANIAHRDRWIEHINNRLAYERALLSAKGGLPADQKPLEVGGAVLYRGVWLEITRINKSLGAVSSVSTKPDPRHSWRSREIMPYDEIRQSMTKAEYSAAGKPQYANVTDSPAPVYHVEESKPWEELEQAAASVTAVSAPELFPTPPAVLETLVDYLPALAPDAVILEPSAGTGALVKLLRSAYPGRSILAVELDAQLARSLEQQGAATQVNNDDFLTMIEGPMFPMFDLCVMNPPFSAEVAHVRRAFEAVKVGGTLISVMSEGPFFRERDASFRAWLAQVGGASAPLPAGSFQPATGVNTRLVTIVKQ